MIWKITGTVFLGLLSAFCFYIAAISHSSRDSQGYWMFMAFGMLFFIPAVLIVINLFAQRSKKARQVYNKMTGADKPETARFVPHWFMTTAGIILLLCLLSFMARIVSIFFKK